MVVSYDSSYYRTNKGGFMIQSHPTHLDDYLISWKKAFLTDVTSFDRSQLGPFFGNTRWHYGDHSTGYRTIDKPHAGLYSCESGCVLRIDTRGFSYKVVSNARAFTCMLG